MTHADARNAVNERLHRMERQQPGRTVTMPELRKDGVTEMLRALVAGQECVQLRQEGAAELSVLRSRIVGTRTDTRPSRRSGRHSGSDSSEEECGDSEAKRSHAGWRRAQMVRCNCTPRGTSHRLTRSTARGILELCLGPSNKVPRETKLGGERKDVEATECG